MLYVKFILFVLVWSALLYGAHYFLFFSAVRFFPVMAGLSRNTLAVWVGLLSVSFLLASICAHHFQNLPTRVFYFTSGCWMGLLVNLLLASAAVWFVIGAAKILGFNLNAAVWGGICFSLAFFVSIYGVWNAFHPRIKNVSVTIPNLPEQWKNKKIVQISDIHLGIIHRQRFLKEVVRKVNEVQPAMVLLTGDFFDGMDKDLNGLAEPLDQVQAEKGVFFVTGNHETYIGVEKVYEAFLNMRTRVLHDEVVDVDGLKLIGIGFAGRGEDKDPVALLRSLKKDYFGRPNILLFHSPTHSEEFMQCGVNLQLSGHTHKGQMFPFGLITRWMYHGHDYGLFQAGDYTLYTTNGTGSWGPPMRIGNTPEIVVVTLL
jgi:predicted MPP superfamily phosphohydrolase